MPEKTEEKIEKKKEPMVELDTSGPGADVELPADKVTETEVEVKDDQETKTTEDIAKSDDAPAESDKQPDVQTSQPQDQKLEEYSKGVQGRISKLTRRMRESERREKAAVEYAQAVESNRQAMESRFHKVDKDYVTKLESSVNSGLEAAQKELGAAIEAETQKLKSRQTKE